MRLLERFTADVVYSEAGKDSGGVVVGVLAVFVLLCKFNLLGVKFRVVTYHRVDLNSSERGGGHPEEGRSLETE